MELTFPQAPYTFLCSQPLHIHCLPRRCQHRLSSLLICGELMWFDTVLSEEGLETFVVLKRMVTAARWFYN